MSQTDLVQVSIEQPLSLISTSSANGVDLSTDEIDRKATDCAIAAGKSNGNRPSNETFMHCLLGPVTLHTHPPVVTSIVCQRGWREKITALIPDAMFVEYQTPGIRLAMNVAKVLQENNWKQGDKAVLFLQNHGLVVSAPTAIDVAALTNDVVAKLSYFLGVDWSRYRLSNRISDLVLSTSGQSVCSYYCEDRVLQNAIKRNSSVIMAQPVFPDQVVYCGPGGLELTSLDDEKPLLNYIDRYGQLPRVVLYKASTDHLFIVSENMRKCRDIEQVLKAHALTLMSASIPQVQFLPDDELIYLMNWEAEKYRQKV
jgi:rhamnose utilization protein RhaD (predicted bifunctional aldolase and dehydrogenase)